MPDWTINDTMSRLRYGLSCRKIYNDIRSEIGIINSETVVDSDADYSWKKFTKNTAVRPGATVNPQIVSKSGHDPVQWKLFSNSGSYIGYMNGDGNNGAAYNYNVELEPYSTNEWATLWITNNESAWIYVRWTVGYKYLSQEEMTHEESFPMTLSVRAYDADSIANYGRRVMNLTWSEGTEEPEMQAIVEQFLTKYKDPVGVFSATIIGDTDTKRTQIYTREISDTIGVVCTRIGANVTTYINAIKIKDTPVGIPICEWTLEEQRAYEALSLFTLDTSELDGPDILGF